MTVLVGKGTPYHLQSCPVCNPKGVFVGNALTMAEAAKARLIPCTKCNPPSRKPTVTLSKVVLTKNADTFVLDDGKAKDDVRLKGIDAPEITGKQAYSTEAMAAQKTEVTLPLT